MVSKNKKMKRLFPLILTSFLLPTAVNSEIIPKITNYELLTEFKEKIKFRCPTKKEKGKHNKQYVVKLYEECWFQLNNDHINIMDRQKIYKKDIISYWDMFETSKFPFIATHFINYKVKGEIKRIEFSNQGKFLRADYLKEHKKLKEAISIWMNTK